MKKILTLIIISFIAIIGCDTSSNKITTTNTAPEKDRLQVIQERGVLTFASGSSFMCFCSILVLIL